MPKPSAGSEHTYTQRVAITCPKGHRLGIARAGRAEPIVVSAALVQRIDIESGTSALGALAVELLATDPWQTKAEALDVAAVTLAGSAPGDDAEHDDDDSDLFGLRDVHATSVPTPAPETGRLNCWQGLKIDRETGKLRGYCRRCKAPANTWTVPALGLSMLLSTLAAYGPASTTASITELRTAAKDLLSASGDPNPDVRRRHFERLSDPLSRR